MRIRLVIVSDTHNKFDSISIPDADILIHCGDITINGTIEELNKFSNSLKLLKPRVNQIIVIPGNRDKCVQDFPDLSLNILNEIATTLINQFIISHSLLIYGTPYMPEYKNQAFEVSDSIRSNLYSQIPENLDILITHTPPKWILDLVHTTKGVNNAGCNILYKVVNQVKPQLCVFGHIHEGYGYTNINNITYINAAICDTLNRPVHKPIVLDYDTITKTCHIRV